MTTLRVLHVVATGQRRGAEVFAADLVRALAREGVGQRVGVVRGERMEVPFEAPVAVLGGGGARLPGLRVEPASVLALRRLIRAWRPHVVQAHGGEPLKHAVAAAAGAGSRVVYRRIGGPADAIRSRARRLAYAGMMRRAARVVAVAEASRRDVVERFGIPPARVVTIPNAADAERLRPARALAETRGALGLPPEGLLFLSVGALTWEKDPLGALEAAAEVLEAVPGAAYAVAGDGPLRGALEAEARRRGLAGRVLLLGSRDDVPDLMAAADALLLASRTEGMPGCLIEAGMAGLPAAAYAVGGVPEVLGETGLLAPPGDRRALAGCALRLAREPDTRRALGEAARERCRDRFEIRRVAPRYLGVYREVAGAAEPGG